MKKRLESVIAHAGIASRRKAATIIKEGKVTIDGIIIREKGYRVDDTASKICVDGKTITSQEKKLYFLLNKPKNVVSTVKDTHKRKTVLDIIGVRDSRLYPVGRLDKDTTGLIIITNDGDLTYRLSHPRFEVEKEYMVKIDSNISDEKIKKLERGVTIDDKVTYPCSAKVIKSGEKESIISVILHEGMKREIRRMFEAIGYNVLELDRVRYAGLVIGKLKRGEHRVLTESEVKTLLKG